MCTITPFQNKYVIMSTVFLWLCCLESIMSPGLHGWTAPLRGISVPLSRHTSHTRRWHWLHIRDSLTSSLLFFFFYSFYLTRSTERRVYCGVCVFVWGGADRCGGPKAGPGQGKVWKVNLSPRRCWLWESWSVTFDMSLIQQGVQQDTDRCKLSPRPAEDALRHRSIRLNGPWHVRVEEATLIGLLVRGVGHSSCIMHRNNTFRVSMSFPPWPWILSFFIIEIAMACVFLSFWLLYNCYQEK